MNGYNNYYSYNTTPTSYDAGNFLLLLLIFFFIFAIIYVVYALLLSQIFAKAGVARWIAWVPVYNHWKMLQLGNQQGFWAIIAYLPVVGIVGTIFTYIAMYYIGKKLGKPDAFVLWAIFLPIVWLVWLAVDDSKWEAVTPSTLTDTQV